MEIKPIRNENDLQNAETEIERLWGAAEGTQEFDHACVLLTLVDAYQREHQLVPVPDPIAGSRSFRVRPS